MSAIFNYNTGESSGSGKLGKLTRDARLLKKTKNRHGVIRIVAAVASDSGAFPDGNFPSEIAVNMVSEFFMTDVFEKMKTSDRNLQVEKSLKDLFARINTLIYSRGIQQGQHVKLSLSVVIAVEDSLYSCHVGTGKIVKFGSRGISILSSSGPHFSQAVKEGMTVDQALKTTFEGEKAEVMGVAGTVSPRFVMEDIKPGEKIALFSKGIDDFIPDEEIKVIFNSVDTLKGACHRLVSISKQRGLRDNATIVVFSLKTGDDDTGKPLDEIVEEPAEKKSGCSCSGVYLMILTLLLVIMVVGSYVGYRHAKKLSQNLYKATSAPTESPEPVGLGQPGLGRFFLVKDPKTMELNFFRLNGKKLDLDQGRYEIFDAHNVLELLPILEKGTYTLTIKMNSKNYYQVFEGSSRNVIQLYEDNVKVHLTRGSVASVYPDESTGITSLVIEGLGSPVKISFQKQNLVIKATPEQTEEAEKSEEVEEVEPSPAETDGGN